MTTTTTKKTAARPELKAIETAVTASHETLDNIVKISTDAHQVTQQGLEHVLATTKVQVEKGIASAKEQVEKSIATAKEQVVKGSDQFFKSYDELTSFSKDNYDAIAQASQILVKGAEEAGKAFVALTQAQVEAAVATLKASLSATTLRDAFELHAGFYRTSFDKALAESSNFSNRGAKLAGEAFAPIQARLTAASTVVSTAAAKFGKAA